MRTINTTWQNADSLPQEVQTFVSDMFVKQKNSSHWGVILIGAMLLLGLLQTQSMNLLPVILVIFAVTAVASIWETTLNANKAVCGAYEWREGIITNIWFKKGKNYVFVDDEKCYFFPCLRKREEWKYKVGMEVLVIQFGKRRYVISKEDLQRLSARSE